MVKLHRSSHYDGVSIERTAQALERYAPILAESRGLNGAQLLDACRAVDDLPQALAAIDLALWDRGGRIAGKPIAALLTDDPASMVPVNATISSGDRADVAEEAAAAAAAGFQCIKLKVGLATTPARVAAARAAAGPRWRCAWMRTARGMSSRRCARSRHWRRPGSSSSRSPCTVCTAMREVRERVAVTDRDRRDGCRARRARRGRGRRRVPEDFGAAAASAGRSPPPTLVRASGAEAYIASTFDGPLGVAAGVHAAAALASRGAVPSCGLATLDLFEGIEDPLPVQRRADRGARRAGARASSRLSTDGVQ